jgi:hypothetical protein
VLLGHEPNKTFLVPDSCRETERNSNSIRPKKNICVFTVTQPTLWIFTQNLDNHFCCLSSSNALFIQLLSFLSKYCIIRHKKASINDGLPEISKMKYRNWIPEPGMTISGFADNKKKRSQPTDPRFFWHVTVNTHFFFLA